MTDKQKLWRNRKKKEWVRRLQSEDPGHPRAALDANEGGGVYQVPERP